MSDSKRGGRGGSRRSDPSKPPGASAPANEAEEIERALKMGPGDFPDPSNWNPKEDMAAPKEKAQKLIDMIGELEQMLNAVPLDNNMRDAMARMMASALETLTGIKNVETNYTNMHEQYKNANQLVQLGFNPDLPMPNLAEIRAEQADIPSAGGPLPIAVQAPPIDLSAAYQSAASNPSGSAPSQDINAMISAALFSHVESIASSSSSSQDQPGSSTAPSAKKEFRFSIPAGASLTAFDPHKIPMPTGVSCDVLYFPPDTVFDANGVPSNQPLPPPPSSMIAQAPPPSSMMTQAPPTVDAQSALLAQLLLIQQQFQELGMQGTFFEQPSTSQAPSNQPPPSS